jgi:hypothetical protein
VAGYKNLSQPIVLDGLGPINLIHGANNVGKSNLLQAMALFFRCLLLLSDPPPLGAKHGAPQISDLAPDPRSLFNLDRPAPILLNGVLDVPPDELAAAGIEDEAGTTIDVELRLQWDASAGTSTEVKRFRFADGKDLAQEVTSSDDKARAMFFPKFLAKNLTIRDGPAERFSMVGVGRSLDADRAQRAGDIALIIEMFDCRESEDPVRRDRWRAFVRAMEQFRQVTGEGKFEVTFQRVSNQVRLVFDTDRMRLPYSLLGTGVQQVAALLGHILMRSASIVAIEEPELNLRWDLQNHLREALVNLVGEPHGTGGVDQIFLTSHSPAFETGERFWLMQAGPKGPVVSPRPASELDAVLGSAPRHLGLPERAPQAYVTSQGVVKLPEDVAGKLGVASGGGVVFLDAEPHGVRILSNDDYLDELGLIDAPPDVDASA